MVNSTIVSLTIILIYFQRYYYENFYSLGKRPPEPNEPEHKPGQAQVSCDQYDMGSCRAYGNHFSFVLHPPLSIHLIFFR